MNADEPKPEVKAAEPKPDAEAIKPKPDPKALELTHDTKGAELKPDINTEPKTEVKPETKVVRHGTTFGNKIIFALAVIGILAGLVAAYIFGMQRKAQPPVFQPVSNPYTSAIYANGMIESDQSNGENINIFPEVSGPITRLLVHEGEQVSSGTLLFTIDDSVQSANVELAKANLRLARDQYDKDRNSYDMDPKSISKDVLDTAKDTVNQTTAALKAANALLQYYSVKAPVAGVVLAVNAAVGG